MPINHTLAEVIKTFYIILSNLRIHIHIDVSLLKNQKKNDGRSAHEALEASAVIAVADVDKFQRIDFLATSSTGVWPLGVRRLSGGAGLLKVAGPVSQGSEYVITTQTARTRWCRVLL